MLFSRVTKLSLLVFFLTFRFAIAQTRMAAELEFDLKFFAENAPIRKYFDVTKSGAELMAEEFDVSSNPDSVFIRKKSLDPAVIALLDRFEFAWETGFKPPKLEIRHRGTRSPIQVKSDIKAMLRLFASSDAEAVKLYNHLSSIKAANDSIPHLNLHLHASDSKNRNRLESFKGMQLLAAMELLNGNSAADSLRVFSSSSSSYSEYPWARGIGRALGFSRYESRKRNISVFEDIDRLNLAMSAPAEISKKQINEKIVALLKDDIFEKALNSETDANQSAVKAALFSDLLRYSTEHFEADDSRRLLSFLMAPQNSKKLVDLQGKISSLNSLRLLYSIKETAIKSGVNFPNLDEKIHQALTSLPSEDRTALLKWAQQNLSSNTLKDLYVNPDFRDLILNPIKTELDKVKGDFVADPQLKDKKLIDFLELDTSALPEAIKTDIEDLKLKTTSTEGFWKNNLQGLLASIHESPMAIFDHLSHDQIASLVSFLEANSKVVPLESQIAVNELIAHYKEESSELTKGKIQIPKGSNCKRWLSKNT